MLLKNEPKKSPENLGQDRLEPERAPTPYKVIHGCKESAGPPRKGAVNNKEYATNPVFLDFPDWLIHLRYRVWVPS